MTMAVTESRGAWSAGGAVRVDGQHLGVGSGLRRACGHHLRGAHPAGQDRHGQARAGSMHGAKIIQVDGNFDDCLELARKLTADFPTIALVNSVNPVPHRGAEDRGVRDRRRAGHARPTCTPCRSATPATSPRTGRATPSTTATGSPTGCRGCSARRPRARRRWCSVSRSRTPRPSPPRSGSARPRRGRRPSTAQRGVERRFLAATDEEILAAYHLIARTEGVFVEPASAASVAGLLESVEDGWVAAGSTVVCTVTGNGLKDPDTALEGHADGRGRSGRPGRGGRRARTGLAEWIVGDPDSSCGADGDQRGAGVEREPGPRIRQPRARAEPLRRDRGRDNRIRARRRGRGRGRGPGSAGLVPPRRASDRARPAAVGRRGAGSEGAVPQRHSAFSRTRLVGRGGGRRSRRRQRSCRQSDSDR